MGLWGPDLNIDGVPPLIIQKLAIVGWIISPASRPISTATIRVRPLDQPELVQSVELPDQVPIRANAKIQHVQFAIGLGNLNISGAGMIETFVEIDGEIYLANRTHVNLTSREVASQVCTVR